MTIDDNHNKINDRLLLEIDDQSLAKRLIVIDRYRSARKQPTVSNDQWWLMAIDSMWTGHQRTGRGLYNAIRCNATFLYSINEDLQTLQTEQNATRPKIRLMLPLIPLSRASTHPLPARILSEINFTASKLNDQVPTTTAILVVWRGWTGKIISSSVS